MSHVQLLISIRGLQSDFCETSLEQLAPHLVPGCKAKFESKIFGSAASEGTSIQRVLQSSVPVIVEVEQFLEARRNLLIFGVARLRQELGEIVDVNGEMELYGEPVNFFARLGGGVLPNMNGEEQREWAKRQKALGPYEKDFVVMVNKTAEQRRGSPHCFRYLIQLVG